MWRTLQLLRMIPWYYHVCAVQFILFCFCFCLVLSRSHTLPVLVLMTTLFINLYAVYSVAVKVLILVSLLQLCVGSIYAVFLINCICLNELFYSFMLKMTPFFLRCFYIYIATTKAWKPVNVITLLVLHTANLCLM